MWAIEKNSQVFFILKTSILSLNISKSLAIMSEQHFDQYEHYNYDQDKEMFCGKSGKQRSKKEADLNTNHHNPGGHERKIVTKLQNTEAKAKVAAKKSNS